MGKKAAGVNPDKNQTLAILTKCLEGAESALAASSDVLDAQACALAKDERDILIQLAGPLQKDPPGASQFAEAAFVIGGICLQQKRALNVVDEEKGDLNSKRRLNRDRVIGDTLCTEVLASRQIPCTKGPFQSSSFRSGYTAKQVRSDALKNFAKWVSSDVRTVQEIQSFIDALALVFQSAAASLPTFPALNAFAFTFVNYRKIREELLSSGSKGAFEQYLLCGLLHQEVSKRHEGLFAVTKSVKANDAASKSPGDIQIRSRTHISEAIEVSANEWPTKLHQLGSIASSGLIQVTIAASGTPHAVSANEFASLVEPEALQHGVDPAVVDIHSLMDITASRLTPHDRVAAFREVYNYLIKYHRAEPELAYRLIAALEPYRLIPDGNEADSRQIGGVGAEIEEVSRSILRELDESSDSSEDQKLAAVGKLIKEKFYRIDLAE